MRTMTTITTSASFSKPLIIDTSHEYVVGARKTAATDRTAVSMPVNQSAEMPSFD
jgi:hypothetical protein